jgi:anti-sigma B factor antagonist
MLQYNHTAEASIMLKREVLDSVEVLSFEVDKLDSMNYKDFKSEAKQIVAAGGKVVLDVSDLKFVDSSGLGAILSLLRHLREQEGDLAIAGPQPAIVILFELVHLERIVGVYETREEARAALSPS